MRRFPGGCDRQGFVSESTEGLSTGIDERGSWKDFVPPATNSRPSWTHLISRCTALNSGASAVRTHSRQTISTLHGITPEPSSFCSPAW